VPAFVYMMRCADNSLYTGWTNNLEQRIKKHEAGTGAKSTHAKKAVALVYYEELADKSAALKREYAIKQLSKDGKEALVRNFKENKKSL
jgi:putative endonuclease